MALLRWIHLRKLMPIEDLIAGGGRARRPRRRRPGRRRAAPATPRAGSAAATSRPPRTRAVTPASPQPFAPRRRRLGSALGAWPSAETRRAREQRRRRVRPAPGTGDRPAIRRPAAAGGVLKDALLAEIRKSKAVLLQHGVAQAQRIEVRGDRVTFTFAPASDVRSARSSRTGAWLEAIATQAGRPQDYRRRPTLTARQPAAPAGRRRPGQTQSTRTRKPRSSEQALADAGVQAMLEVFPAEIRDVEEM